MIDNTYRCLSQTIFRREEVHLRHVNSLKMPGKRGARALREHGLEKTDNEMEFTSWPQVNMINQKNYYTYVFTLGSLNLMDLVMYNFLDRAFVVEVYTFHEMSRLQRADFTNSNACIIVTI